MRRARGFTLLEVMISLAILGGALMVLLRMSTSNIRATHRAKLLTIATGLANAKMLDLEEELKRNGFQETNQELEGDFDDEKQPKFTWKAVIEKVELPEAPPVEGGGTATGSTPPPSPDDEKNQEQLLGLADGSTSGAMGAGMVQLYFPLIRPVLEQAIRKVTLEVHWKTGGEEDSIKVIAFYTDKKAIDQAAAMFGGGATTPQPSTRDPGTGGGTTGGGTTR